MKRTRPTSILLFAGVLLAGCSVGIKEDGSNGLRDGFTVPVTYQEAYRRADAFARHCHQSANFAWKASFNVSGDLYTDNRTGIVRVSYPGTGRDEEEIKVAAMDDGSARVDVTLWGTGIWDQRELAAVRLSMKTGAPSCR